nr:hypothetical protein [Haliscomenobacter sp.]
MTQNSAQVLIDDYGVLPKNIEVIPHGTHLVPHLDKTTLKEKYGLSKPQSAFYFWAAQFRQKVSKRP